NGAALTTIQGYQVSGTNLGDAAVRCVYLTNWATLAGFTLASGATRAAGDLTNEQCGGGAFCVGQNAVLSGCVLVSNAAWQNGGGAYSGTLSNCALTRNSATNGGGACSNILNQCTLTSNS